MKTIITFLFFICSVNILHSETKAEEAVDTDGNGYRNISTLAHLRWLSETESAWSDNYELDNDIDASETREWNLGDHDNNPSTPDSAMGWKPIGIDTLPPYHIEKTFTGTFNGNGYTISGIHINRPTEYYVGFFALISASSSIHDLSFKDADITGYNSVGILIGSITFKVKNENIRISNCHISGEVKGIDMSVGLFCGDVMMFPGANLDIENCTSEGKASGLKTVAGFIGDYNSYYDSDFRILTCSSNAEITAKKSVAAGFIASIGSIRNARLIIHGCYSEVNLEAVENVGGFLGLISGEDVVVRNCYSLGKIKTKFKSAGFCGKNSECLIENCYASVEVNNDRKTSGFCEENEGLILSCYWDKEVSGKKESEGGVALSSSAMRADTSYKAWDFETIWKLDPNVNDGLPFLRLEEYTGDAPIDADFDGYSEIWNLKNLKWIADNQNAWARKFILMADIDASETRTWNIGDHDRDPNTPDSAMGWKPIAWDTTKILNESLSFSGEFNGNDHIISGLYINRLTNNPIGLFSILISDAVVKDLSLDNVEIYGADYTGALSGAVITASSKYGITDINNCTVHGTVSGNDYVGGFVGYIRVMLKGEIQISFCKSEVDVFAQGEYSGGFCGVNFGYDMTSLISDSEAHGNVIGNDYVGGFIGRNESKNIFDDFSKATIRNCKSYGYVEGNSTVGAFCGSNYSVDENLLNDFKVSATEIIDCMSYGNVKGKSSVGGFCGENNRARMGGNPRIMNCESHGDVEGEINVGAFCGIIISYSSGAEISKSYSFGNASGKKYVGGFCGINIQSEISECGTSSEVLGDSIVGGFSGSLYYPDRMDKCYSTGAVSGEIFVGGFTGDFLFDGSSKYVKLQNLYSRSDVNGEEYVAGFCGFAKSDSDEVKIKLQNCYSTGVVLGNTDKSGFINCLEDQNDFVNSSYWDKESSFINTSDFGEGRTTAEMKNISNYIGWDFDTIWDIDPSINDGYPYFRGHPPVGIEENYEDREDIRFSIYPNPAAEYINFSFSEEYSVEVRISIIDLLGKEYEIYTGIVQDNLKLDISEFPVARYFVRVSSNTISETLPLLIE